ncbi:hypothetical protein Tco_1499352 [Tanacetum coccineum]
MEMLRIAKVSCGEIRYVKVWVDKGEKKGEWCLSVILAGSGEDEQWTVDKDSDGLGVGRSKGRKMGISVLSGVRSCTVDGALYLQFDNGKVWSPKVVYNYLASIILCTLHLGP